jgi:hypothetical protein
LYTLRKTYPLYIFGPGLYQKILQGLKIVSSASLPLFNFKFHLNSAIIEDAGDISSPASQARPAFALGAADGGRARRGGLGASGVKLYCNTAVVAIKVQVYFVYSK